jgi:arylsulfatase A-like enzyme
MANPDPDKFKALMSAAYNTEIEYLDAYLGRLFEGLKQRGGYDDTLIVFVADHGEEFNDHQGWWHGYTLYDEVVHVPILLKLPGNQHGGTRNTELARIIDLPPTMLHLAGLEKGKEMAGQTLYDRSGVFTNAAIGFSYAENDFEGNTLQAVRTKERKLIHANEDNVSNLEAVELYDVVNDPREQTNLAGDSAHKAGLDELEKKIAGYQAFIHENAAEPSADVALSGDAADQLGALGYLE